MMDGRGDRPLAVIVLVVLVLLLAAGAGALYLRFDDTIPIRERAEPVLLDHPLHRVSCQEVECDKRPIPPTRQQWSAGDTIYVWRRFCVTRHRDGVVERRFENAAVHRLPDIVSRTSDTPGIGCYEATFHVEIPLSLYPGRYQYRVRVTQDVNILKTITYSLKPVDVVVVTTPTHALIDETKRQLHALQQEMRKTRIFTDQLETYTTLLNQYLRSRGVLSK